MTIERAKQRILNKRLKELNSETILVVQIHNLKQNYIININEKEIPKAVVGDNFNVLRTNLQLYLQLKDNEFTILNIFKY